MVEPNLRIVYTIRVASWELLIYIRNSTYKLATYTPTVKSTNKSYSKL